MLRSPRARTSAFRTFQRLTEGGVRVHPPPARHRWDSRRCRLHDRSETALRWSQSKPHAAPFVVPEPCWSFRHFETITSLSKQPDSFFQHHAGTETGIAIKQGRGPCAPVAQALCQLWIVGAIEVSPTGELPPVRGDLFDQFSCLQPAANVFHHVDTFYLALLQGPGE